VEFILLIELHEELRIARIHASFDSVLHLLIVAAGSSILVSELTHTAESQEWTKTELRRRLSLQKSVTDKDTILIVNKELLLLQDYATHAIDGSRDMFTVKLTDVLVSVGTEIVSLVFV
jgi:hypothetical protein